MEGLMIQQDAMVPAITDIEQATNRAVEMVVDGEIHPLKALGQLAAIDKWTALVRKKIMDSAIDAMHEDKEVNIYGADFQLAEAGVTYKFEDEGLKELEEQKKLIEAEIAGRKETLRRSGLARRESTTIVKVKLKK